jgi:hypothetical protein
VLALSALAPAAQEVALTLRCIVVYDMCSALLDGISRLPPAWAQPVLDRVTTLLIEMVPDDVPLRLLLARLPRLERVAFAAPDMGAGTLGAALASSATAIMLSTTQLTLGDALGSAQLQLDLARLRSQGRRELLQLVLLVNGMPDVVVRANAQEVVYVDTRGSPTAGNAAAVFAQLVAARAGCEGKRVRVRTDQLTIGSDRAVIAHDPRASAAVTALVDVLFPL